MKGNVVTKVPVKCNEFTQSCPLEQKLSRGSPDVSLVIHMEVRHHVIQPRDIPVPSEKSEDYNIPLQPTDLAGMK